jgi:hypothetical protein
VNCDEFRSAVLAGEESEAIAHHEQTCPSCRSQAGDLREAHQSLSDEALWEEPSPELAFQVEDLIRNAARGSRYPTSRERSWGRFVAAAAVVMILAGAAILASGRNSPDWDVALPATDMAPNAIVSVRGWNEDAGTRMVVSIDGLAPAPAGFVYEFWLSDGPVHISAGTFRSPGEIELWAGVARADFPRLWITLEPIDEDESPSGTTVLDTGRV